MREPSEDTRAFGMFQIARMGKPLDATVEFLRRGFGDEEADAFHGWMLEKQKHTHHLDLPVGWRDPVVKEIKQEPWYAGPDPMTDVAWRGVRPILESKIGEAAAGTVDQASSKIVSSMANPHRHAISMRGLVLGYVQSGKTANYTATIAKAADAGYKLIIVLGGIHNALRQQTQRRLDVDLVETTHRGIHEGDWRWAWLTEDERDFAAPSGAAETFLAAKDVRLLAVVKKNKSRLTRLVSWLKRAHPSVRQACPMLLIDDESDQASVNTAREGKKRTAINALVRELLEVMPTSTYVGYTATPFANVLIDPKDENSLYPRNFIFNLPRPSAYQGSEVLFGRNDLDEDDDAFDGYDVLRVVPESEAAINTPPRNKEERENFQSSAQPSLHEAVRWFLLATAARRARGQDGHSSMLVHTTAYVAPQFDMADTVRGMLKGYDAADSEFADLWARESKVNAPPTNGAKLAYDDVVATLPDVLESVRVVVDNGQSDDRLDYTSGSQTVVAVGGNTLSRGLTLEGLVCSYFTRAAGSYDTLLQMGRWFGYRPGYEDLPRIWTESTTAEAFRFLSTVEEEIRRDIDRYESESLTPSQFAVRVRTHPTMAITSALKMQNAYRAEVSYSGKRLQTFLFAHRDEDALTGNLAAGRTLVSRARASAPTLDDLPDGLHGFRNVPSQLVRTFLTDYRFHADHVDLDGDAISSWLDRRDEAGHPVKWNVVVAGRASQFADVDGEELDLGAVDLGLGRPVPCVNRARMRQTSKPNRADIKVLVSKHHLLLDIPDSTTPANHGDAMDQRRDHAPSTGLVLLYPISKDSVPMGVARKHAAREPLDAKEHVLGIGLVFPDTPPGMENDSTSYNYVSVRLVDADPIEVDEDEAAGLDEDTEGDAHVDLPAGVTSD